MCLSLFPVTFWGWAFPRGRRSLLREADRRGDRLGEGGHARRRLSLRLASTGAIRRYLAHNQAQFDPRKYLQETINEMKAICKDRYEAFGTAGWADKITPICLEDMYQRYESGELDPKVG